jgi:serine protease inhibitor
MKKILAPLFIIAFTFLFSRCEDQFIFPDREKKVNLTVSEQKIVSSSGIFGLKLFKKVNSFEGDKNIFISPLSVSMALGMTLNGANGSTYDSIKAVLELNGLTEQEINESYKSLINKLINVDPEVIFNIANSIWYRKSMTFQQDFINTNKIYFNAEISGLDFSDPVSLEIINNWVDQSTNGKIDKILDRIPPGAVMYLINAIYFKGDWKYQFNKELTRDDYFISADGSSSPCKMMVQKNNFLYYSNDLFQAADLPYGDSLFSMTIILPLPDKNINEVINQLNKANWSEWLGNLKVSEGEIQMPKFESRYELKLNDVLTDLGMGIAFGNADFTKMYPPGGLWISEVKHKTYVKTDEEGTEAAAATSVEIIRTSIGSGFFMKINRPFIYIISERSSNTILFIGKMVNPGLAGI